MEINCYQQDIYVLQDLKKITIENPNPTLTLQDLFKSGRGPELAKSLYEKLNAVLLLLMDKKEMFLKILLLTLARFQKQVD